jgi:hypothetical protein
MRATWIWLWEQFVTVINPPDLQVVLLKFEYLRQFYQEWSYRNPSLNFAMVSKEKSRRCIAELHKNAIPEHIREYRPSIQHKTGIKY